MDIEDRLEYNLMILKELERMLKEHPQLRFMQLINNLNLIDINLIFSEGGYGTPSYEVKDHYAEEPWKTLERIKGEKDEENT